MEPSTFLSKPGSCRAPEEACDEDAAHEYEHHSHRNFGDHQARTQTAARASDAAARTGVAQRVRNAARCDSQRGRWAEEDSVYNRDGDGEPQHRPSARVSASLGMETGASAGSCFHATAVKTNPANPPAAARTQLSVTSWRTIRLGPPPRARRTLISQCRASDRASRRFATLAQPINMNRKGAYQKPEADLRRAQGLLTKTDRV